MGLFAKLKFWKKEAPLDIDTGLDTSFAPAPSPNAGLPTPGSGFGTPRYGDPVLDNTAFGQQGGFDQPSFSQKPSFGYDQPKIISETSPGFSQNVQRDTYDKNLEIVSMKLDNIKAALENLNQRLINIERMAMDSMRQEPRRPNW